MGLIKLSARAAAGIRDFYHSLDKSAAYDGKDFDNMYMTSFIQVGCSIGLLLSGVVTCLLYQINFTVVHRTPG
jgi:hypothetical protein